ncbi:recombinase family protein [Paraburkholderia sp. FT54]|uniref:recombinase family protein n=1 Tax=Paraburkholderia sp. FT54 TaxID=3074437 RepID=UPI002877661B|nr:recombinase family protein [Paraburkholderia sp. FT54]WNC93194.1 recombinase family protein [Paraburkholderia sp. FT54]
MSEAELHVLKARLCGGILNKVKRGEHRCLLPTGFVYDELGNVVLDPDSQVRETIAYFFEIFWRVGSASQTVKVFKNEGLLFPSCTRNEKFVTFQHLTASTALRMLNNPRYAGAYAYGRRHYRRIADGWKVPRRRDRNDWLAWIPDAHPGYITWEQFQQNLKVLETNGRGYEVARSSPPREGAALLQGRAVCRRCGRHLRLRYATRRGRQEAWYVCDRAQGAHGEPTCQSIAGAPINEAVGALVVASMTPAAVELAWEIRQEQACRERYPPATTILVSGGVKFVQNGRFEIHIDAAITRWWRAGSAPRLTLGRFLDRIRQPQGKSGKGAKKNQVVDKPDTKKTNQEKTVPRSEFHTVKFRRHSSCR